jgi:hypothetical protein
MLNFENKVEFWKRLGLEFGWGLKKVEFILVDKNWGLENKLSFEKISWVLKNKVEFKKKVEI